MYLSNAKGGSTTILAFGVSLGEDQGQQVLKLAADVRPDKCSFSVRQVNSCTRRNR